MAEIGNGYNQLVANARHFAQHFMRLLGCLQGLAQNHRVKTIIRIIRQIAIGIALHNRQPARHAGIDAALAQFKPAPVNLSLMHQQVKQRTVAATDIQHFAAGLNQLGDLLQIDTRGGQIAGSFGFGSIMRATLGVFAKPAGLRRGGQKTVQRGAHFRLVEQKRVMALITGNFDKADIGPRRV